MENTSNINGLYSFLRLVAFQYRGLNHLELHGTLTIEAWLNQNNNFDCRYLEL